MSESPDREPRPLRDRHANPPRFPWVVPVVIVVAVAIVVAAIVAGFVLHIRFF